MVGPDAELSTYEKLSTRLSVISLACLVLGLIALATALPGVVREEMSYPGLAGGFVLLALGAVSLFLISRYLNPGMGRTRLTGTLIVCLVGVALVFAGACVLAFDRWWGVALVVVGAVPMVIGPRGVKSVVEAGTGEWEPENMKPRRWRPALLKPTRTQMAEAWWAVANAGPDPRLIAGRRPEGAEGAEPDETGDAEPEGAGGHGDGKEAGEKRA